MFKVTHNISMPETITIDGVEHKVEELGVKLKKLLEIHTAWRWTAEDQRLELARTEAALRSLESEIATSVKAGPAETVAEGQPAAETVAPSEADKL